MSVITTALRHTPTGNSRTPAITAELVGLNDAIFKPIRGALGFLRNTIRFPDSSISEQERPSTKEHTISAMHRANKLLSKETALDPKTIASILRKIMINFTVLKLVVKVDIVANFFFFFCKNNDCL